MKSLLGWLGVTDDKINKIVFECLKIEADIPSESVIKPLVFAPREMPENSIKITTDLIKQDERVIPVVEYLYARGLTLDDNNFYWSEKYPDRLIIPLTVDYKIVGYIARKCGTGNPKYITEHPPHVVFNLDKQGYERKFVLVFEGSVDAMLLGGVAVLTNEISTEQAHQINQLGRQVVVVPDRDKAGESMILQAIELGWSVAFPVWDDGVKDAADAVLKYGRLTTLISIINSIETSSLKIKLRMKL
jgi:DNA primase